MQELTYNLEHSIAQAKARMLERGHDIVNQVVVTTTNVDRVSHAVFTLRDRAKKRKMDKAKRKQAATQKRKKRKKK